MSSLDGDANVRKRKAHKKSRHGCGNCKIRRVKCDEGKPQCKSCIAFGVSCSYKPMSSQLQVSAHGAFKVDVKPSISGMLRPPLPCVGPSSSTFQLTWADMAMLERFQRRTAITIGPASNNGVLRNNVLDLALVHPFVLHTVYAVTLIHDSHESYSSGPRHATELAYHWYRATVLLNGKLAKGIEPSERDGLWASAALLGVSAFAAIEAKTPEEAWPLNPLPNVDLGWLKLSTGKREVSKLADISRPDSVFHAVSKHFYQDLRCTSPPGDEMKSLPSEFIQLFQLDSTSTPERNPYHMAATILAQLFAVECRRDTYIPFLTFISKLDEKYEKLLGAKDHRAMLLLAYWYAKLCNYKQWWVWHRAVMECQAICIYLSQHPHCDPLIQDLLQIPRELCRRGIETGR